MSVETVLAFLAGGLVGYIVGSVLEYLKHANNEINASIQKVEKIDATAQATVEAIDTKTKNLTQETNELSGQDLADAINSDYAHSPSIPSVHIKNTPVNPLDTK